jgi:hypothetical protein
LFDLRPESVGTFLDDDTITLPRFQRRSAWTPEQRFRLTLSLFKGYPMGTVVVKRERKGEPPATVSYLLDGRQRRESLQGMRDVETIYSWARKTLKLRPADSTDDVILKYRNYVDEYFFGTEDWEGDPDDDPPLPMLTEDDGQPTEDDLEDLGPAEDTDGLLPPDGDGLDEGLDELLKLILLVHPVTKGGRASGFRNPFNFDKLVEGLDFVRQDEKGNRYVDSSSLLLWLNYQRQMNKETPWPPTREQFLSWLVAGKQVDKLGLVKTRMAEEWAAIEKALLMLETLKGRLNSSVLGYLEIRDGATADDDKKIFEIINTAGTKLSAAEILSAKAAWDTDVTEPPEVIMGNVAALYSEMGIAFDDSVRRWDVAATLLDRLDYPIALGPAADWDWQGIRAKRLERKITLGFKILSGYYQGKLMKDQIAQLPSTSDVQWNTLTLEEHANDASKALTKYWFFEFARAWGFSFIESLSDAIGLDFFLLTVLDWERKNQPKVSGAPLNAFRKNAVILFDRLLFEYVTEVWRGSSDNRVARNLANLRGDTSAVLTPVSKADWERLVLDVVDEGSINGTNYLKKQDPRIALLLMYAMVLAHLRPDDTHETIHVDHIVPQRLFKETQASLQGGLHHISNLELLPESINAVKSGRRLSEVTEPNILAAIERFSRIRQADFARFSSVASTDLLRERRGRTLKSLLIDERLLVLTDPDVHADPGVWVDAKDVHKASTSELAASFEGQQLEFKESARWSHIAGEKEKESELEVLRSVAAFANTDGGTLLIGVANDHRIVGLNKDYKSMQKSPDRDGFQVWLANDVLKARLGMGVLHYLRISFEEFEAGDVCRIDIEPAAEPVYVDGKRFYVRNGGTTSELSTADAVDRIVKKWGKQMRS